MDYKCTRYHAKPTRVPNIIIANNQALVLKLAQCPVNNHYLEPFSKTPFFDLKQSSLAHWVVVAVLLFLLLLAPAPTPPPTWHMF